MDLSNGIRALKRPNPLSFDHFPALLKKVVHAEVRGKGSGGAQPAHFFVSDCDFSKSMVITPDFLFIG